MTGQLEVIGLSKQFIIEQKPLPVLCNINLSVKSGEFVSIIGSSGCGKTTLLRIILGLDTDYEGQVLLNGEQIHGTGLERGVVFQEHRLLPWLTVEDNVAFGLRRLAAAERAPLIKRHLALVGLGGFEKAFPYQLSGGMAQRVAIARALVNRPELLLLDEPLGALDALTRIYMQEELEKIWRKEKISMLMITHDVEEAIYLGDKVVIMSSRPGLIKKIIPVELPRPRDRGSTDFARLKEALLEEFQLGVPKLDVEYTI
ncbi:nitrate/sulfonate/bicarbonate transport system ATP-binding protein [Candidatus Termititenax persephonae]|uniref:Nitrate/sulfonate/bicarbonate transport system ATP-binding protein n=1 Tax=Candidatus Termititenax persephonae TaxID=2218525 RepID=A0A388TI81_9BACT|nr:nitrate/sulfonate/bicarbonate transport system ATP-binding protein [Candidatus Termititenax persephonae]